MLENSSGYSEGSRQDLTTRLVAGRTDELIRNVQELTIASAIEYLQLFERNSYAASIVQRIVDKYAKLYPTVKLSVLIAMFNGNEFYAGSADSPNIEVNPYVDNSSELKNFPEFQITGGKRDGVQVRFQAMKNLVEEIINYNNVVVPGHYVRMPNGFIMAVGVGVGGSHHSLEKTRPFDLPVKQPLGADYVRTLFRVEALRRS